MIKTFVGAAIGRASITLDFSEGNYSIMKIISTTYKT
jgi:hypothetical protein